MRPNDVVLATTRPLAAWGKAASGAENGYSRSHSCGFKAALSERYAHAKEQY